MLGIVLLALLPVVIRDEYFLHVMVMIEINVVMAVSLWLLGITGLISFGQAGFMFIGAMTTALLMKLGGWSFWVSLPLSAIMAAVVSAPVGRLSLRVKGVYFFLITLAFGEVVRGVFAYFEHPFGGWYGIRDIPPPSPAAIFTGMGKMPFYYLGLMLMLVTCAVIYRISRSWFGSVLWNIRERTCSPARSASTCRASSWWRSSVRRSSPASPAVSTPPISATSARWCSPSNIPPTP
ncbi:MAG TPA: branched-chain amino acid ABC transporter permease [Reyranella sp.]|nr:branched-chain amino acid ABC transporter permease [Reyranella sp.]